MSAKLNTNSLWVDPAPWYKIYLRSCFFTFSKHHWKQ